MVAFNLKTTGAAAISVMAFTQMCPAPIPAIVVAAGAVASIEAGVGAGAAAAASGAVAGAVSGAVANSKAKRDLADGAKFRMAKRGGYPPGVNQQDYDRCINEINDQGSPVNFSDSEHGILVENLPPTCMTLANGLTGESGGSYPVPMGSSSIEYWNISDDERNQLSEVIAKAQE